MDDLIEVCVPHMLGDGFTEEQARAYMKQLLPTLDYWKRYEELSDGGQFEAFKKQLMEEINSLHIEGLPKVERLNALVGSYVNLAYPLPSGMDVKFLKDGATYLGNQLESELGGGRCFGVLANMDFILVCTYEAEGANPELVLYKKR
ncbi:MAG: zinc ribbon domain-containing protein, partial [Firmicutes bacterium]|nr:zinc ribbon domain-containing protein [Bacillota bacterium]